MTGTYRVVATIPTVVYIRADDIEEARLVVQTVAERYEHVAYPIAKSSDDRAGIAEPRILSIEVARKDDTIPPMALLHAEGFRKGPESDGEPPHGPSAA